MTIKMTTEDTSPRIYVASLADYNNGQLLGRWFELSDFCDADGLLHAIQGMLTIYDDKYGLLMGSPREEWAVHDAENLPTRLVAESMDFAAVYQYLEVVADMNEERRAAYEYFIDNGDNPEEFDNRFLGRYGESYHYDEERVLADYAESEFFQCHSEDEIPKQLRNYIDWASLGRDYRLSGEIWQTDGYVFRS